MIDYLNTREVNIITVAPALGNEPAVRRRAKGCRPVAERAT